MTHASNMTLMASTIRAVQRKISAPEPRALGCDGRTCTLDPRSQESGAALKDGVC